MFSRIHNKRGTAGSVVAIVALMLTLAGTFFICRRKKKSGRSPRKLQVGPDREPGGDTGLNGMDAPYAQQRLICPAWQTPARRVNVMLNEVDPGATRITEILDSIPGAWEKVQEGMEQAERGEGIPLADLARL